MSTETESTLPPTDIRKLMAGKRFEPKTTQQWQQATNGAATMDEDWAAQLMPRFVGFLGGVTGVELHPERGTYHQASPYYRAGYELRYHEILAYGCSRQPSLFDEEPAA